MSILGINNRTENWKTAYEFSPFFRDSSACARLARKLGKDPGTSSKDIEIQLYWKGLRDYIYRKTRGNRPKPSEYVRVYNKMFGNLRNDIVKFIGGNSENTFRTLKDGNYDVSKLSGEKGLYDNLRNTEIDIVLESPSILYIGEAKQESRLGAAGGLVLVHQLIRQYVTASILLDIMGNEKKVVPFLVVDKDKHDGVLNMGQVNFMLSQKWLKTENVLTWDDIRGLHP